MIYCCEFDGSRVTEEAYKLRRGAVFYYRSNIVLRGWTMKRAVSRAGAMLALWMVLAGAAQARGAEPVARIPLGPMGYQTMVPEFLLAGSSMLRVDFVDAEHLLVTFGLRQLMERLPGDPARRRPNGGRGGGGAADGQGAGARPSGGCTTADSTCGRWGMGGSCCGCATGCR